MKLQIKVPLLVILIILFLGITSTGIQLYYQRQHAMEQFRETSWAVAVAIQSSLEQMMLTGDRSDVQQALVSTGGKEIIKKVAVFEPNGAIAASSETNEIGENINEPEISSALLGGESSIGIGTHNDGEVFHAITPIFNKPECQSCHNPAQMVLGAIEVTLDTAMLNSHLQTETILIALLALAAFVLVGGGIAFMLRKTVLDRLSSLVGTARKLSNGDYSARSAIVAKDEIGMLAITFNEMASNVEQHSHEIELSRQQLAELKSDLEDKVQRRTRELTAMNALLGTLSQSLEPDKMLKDALNSVLKLMEVEAGIIYVANGNTGRLTCVSETGLSSNDTNETFRLKFDEIAKEVVRTGKLVECNQGSSQIDISSFRSLISLPLRTKTTLGVLTLASNSITRYPSETVRLLSAMCDAIGIALENAKATQSIEDANKLREQLLKKLISAQEEERRRIARELHDEASQSLAALAINLEDIADTLPARYKGARDRLAVLKERAVTTLSGVRGLALELRPSALDDLGLSAAIDWYARDYLKKRGLEIKVQIIGQKVKLPPYTETMLFRIAQESLTNIVKHAEATSVSVELQFTTSKVIIRVEDNGKGFDTEATLAKAGMRRNLGIHGMMERATLLGGTLTIKSHSGQGTVLLVEVPLAGEVGQHEENTRLSS